MKLENQSNNQNKIANYSISKSINLNSMTIDIENSTATDSNHYDTPNSLERCWYKDHGLRKLNFLLYIIMLTSSTNGYDAAMLNGFQSLDKWENDMGHPSGATQGALSNGLNLGYFLSFIFAPYISDNYGRKSAIIIGDVIIIVGAIIQTCCNNYASFLISRLIVGAGTTISGVASVPLISECSFPTHRETMTGIYNSQWYSGAVIAAWVIYGSSYLRNNSWSWRLPSLIQIFLIVIQLSFMWWVPESPRYLISKGESEKAKNTLLKLHGNNDESKYGTLIETEMSAISMVIEREKIQGSSSYSAFLKTKGNRKRLAIIITLPIITQLSGTNVVSYYFKAILTSIGITSKSQEFQIYGCLMISNLVTCIFIPLIVSRVKRRVMFLCCIFAMLACFTTWTVLSAENSINNYKNKALGRGVLAMVFINFFCYNCGLCGAPFLYITEVLPFSLRSKGTSIYFMLMYLTIVFSGFVNPIAMSAISWKYYIVYTCWLVVEGFVVFLLFPETKGYSLEEVSKVFGDDPAADGEKSTQMQTQQSFDAYASFRSARNLSHSIIKKTDLNVKTNILE